MTAAPDMPPLKTYDICGVSLTAATPVDAATSIVAAAKAREPYEVHLCNAYTLSLVDRDMELRAALQRADLNLPDGTPVAWLGRRRGTSGPVRGPGLVIDVARIGVPAGIKHYLYGGAPDVADEMRKRLVQMIPGIEIVGVECPPYRRLNEIEVADLGERIRTSGANLVWVGLGTPNQDYTVPRLASVVDAAIVPVGAAFDFISGRVAEAPKMLHGTGLEWLYRLSREPGRLWRRYLIGNPLFVAVALRHALVSARGRSH
jgi:N-acetylglucosaminyldiphosphoundecaprenol N-acetyl-beta-D-mannosaminyltransferase